MTDSVSREKDGLEQLRQAYRDRPDDKDVGACLAQLYVDLGWRNEALRVYTELVARFGDDYSLLLAYGNVCHAHRDYERAAATFRKLTLLRPARVEGWNNLGIVCLAGDDHEAAREAFAKVLQLEPENQGALLNMGNYYDRKGDVCRAIDFFKRAVEIRPDFADAWFNLGNAHVKDRQFEDAVRAYRRALKYNPEYASALKNLGFALEELGEFEEAEKYYLQALEINKADASLYVNVATVCVKRQHHDRAKDYFLRAVKLGPRESGGWMGLRDLSLKKGDVETYVKATMAIAHRLNSDVIVEALRTLRRLGRHRDSESLLRAVDKLGRESCELDAERILSYMRSAETAGKARAIYRRLQRSASLSDTVRCCLAEYALITDDTDTAMQQIRLVKDGNSVSERLYWQILIAQGRRDEAEQRLREYVRSDPECHDAWFRLAQIEAATDREDAAREDLIRALEAGFADVDEIGADPELMKIYEALPHSAGPAHET